MVNDAVVSHNSVNELYYLEEVDSTNTWAKANLDKFGPVGAVYTTSQTAGRGRTPGSMRPGRRCITR